jgi:hypothetical protein
MSMSLAGASQALTKSEQIEFGTFVSRYDLAILKMQLSQTSKSHKPVFFAAAPVHTMAKISRAAVNFLLPAISFMATVSSWKLTGEF